MPHSPERSSQTPSSEPPSPNADEEYSQIPSAGVDSDYDLPSNKDAAEDISGSSEDGATNHQETYHSKHAIEISQSYQLPRDTFVTQLTQPPSSPSAIRGPRWRKRVATPSPPPQQIPQPSDVRHAEIRSQAANIVYNETNNDGDDLEDDELILAAAFSSSDPEDDARSEPLHQAAEGANVEAINSNGRRSPLRRTPSFRQTTLFAQPGSQAIATASEPSREARKWPLVNKVEPPTHHRLDHHACETWVYPTNLGTIRDYQYNIVQRGLFHNILVALPTGLGKTFIAATIMLNWFRWSTNAQIVFMAPTKPLVSQQVDACFRVVGIPRSQTTMLTGNVQPALRAEEWQSKRVFFMTPQTLMHDLKTGICDPKALVLLVVDEAHRATGNYAYVEVVKFLRRFNSSFRVLALTATPGASIEAVQNVIDALDIARVEIRTERSLDIHQYVHNRNIDIELFENSEDIELCLELFSKALQPVLDQLVSLNVYYSRDPTSLTAYGLTKARQKWMGTEAARQAGFPLKAKANAIFNVLASLAHALELLKYHGIGSFYRNLVEFKGNMADGSKGGKYPKLIASNEHFKKLLNQLESWMSDPEFIGHPKLLYLKSVVLNHFIDAGEMQAAEQGRPASDTRIMIFVHYRDSAEEVTRVLRRYEPMIRPHVFVGQTGAKASQGMDQKTQLQVIEKFKQGVYNTIVATSIGEEGLDIGEVDLIVCYDSSSSPIRMLQRMGRTGRKRAGKIALLLMRGKEENSYTAAKDNYEKMQQMIASGTRFTFHEDRSRRIIPRNIVPVPDKRNVEIPIENSQLELPEPRRKARVAKKPAKKFHMPDNVETGFVQASSLSGRRRPDKALGQVDVDIATLPDEASVLLSSRQELELDQRYCNVSGTAPQYVHKPRLDAFPTYQRARRPTKLIGHSGITNRLVRCLDTIRHPLSQPALSPIDYPHHDVQDALDSRPRQQQVRLPAGKAAASFDMSSSAVPVEADSGPASIEAIWSRSDNSNTPRAQQATPATGLSTGLYGTQSSPVRPEKPFYISQKSNADENDIDDDDDDEELPEVGNLVSNVNAAATTKLTSSASSMPPGLQKKQSSIQGQRKRPRIVLEDSDDNNDDDDDD